MLLAMQTLEIDVSVAYRESKGSKEESHASGPC